MSFSSTLSRRYAVLADTYDISKWLISVEEYKIGDIHETQPNAKIHITKLIIEDVDEVDVKGSEKLKTVRIGDNLNVKAAVAIGDFNNVKIDKTVHVLGVKVKDASIEIKCDFWVTVTW